MIRSVYFLGDKLINIGEWEYQYEPVLISEVVFDEEMNIVKEAVYRNVARNPLPEGASMEMRECERDEDGGWYVVGF